MLGFDTLYSNHYTNEQIIRIAAEEKELSFPAITG